MWLCDCGNGSVHLVLEFLTPTPEMTWVTEELKAILVKHSAAYFASKSEDRDELVNDTIVPKLYQVKDDLPKPVRLCCLECYLHWDGLLRSPPKSKCSTTTIFLSFGRAKRSSSPSKKRKSSCMGAAWAPLWRDQDWNDVSWGQLERVASQNNGKAVGGAWWEGAEGVRDDCYILE